ncbi:hypothetical protein QQP08_004883 [Theobroma cacao]|nr:hypothetical protein QQP08_004883 [Theobroma cacao]
METMILKPSFARKLNQEGFSPIHLAVENGHKELALHLMQNDKNLVRLKGKRAPPLKLNPEDFTPIHLAEENGHEELALNLMENGATSHSPLHYAITREQNLGLLARFLEACPECFRDMTTAKQTALHIATRNNRLEALQLLPPLQHSRAAGRVRPGSKVASPCPQYWIGSDGGSP